MFVTINSLICRTNLCKLEHGLERKRAQTRPKWKKKNMNSILFKAERAKEKVAKLCRECECERNHISVVKRRLAG